MDVRKKLIISGHIKFPNQIHWEPRVSLQWRAVFCMQKCICIMFRWTFISILPTREECTAGVSEDDIGRGHGWDRRNEGSSVFMINCCRNELQIYLVESCTRPLMSVLCSVFPLCILYAFVFVCCLSLIRRHLACWNETMRYIFVTGTFHPSYVRCMYARSFGFSTGLTFLPPDNKNSYPFHVRKFNPANVTGALTVKNVYCTIFNSHAMSYQFFYFLLCDRFCQNEPKTNKLTKNKGRR